MSQAIISSGQAAAKLSGDQRLVGSDYFLVGIARFKSLF